MNVAASCRTSTDVTASVMSELTKARWTELARKDPDLHLTASFAPEIDLSRGAEPEFDVFYGRDDPHRDLCAAAVALNSAEMRMELTIPPVFTAVAPIVVGVPAAPAPPLERRLPDVIAWK